MNPWLGTSAFQGTDIARAQADGRARVLRLACRNSATPATSWSVIGLTWMVIFGASSRAWSMLARQQMSLAPTRINSRHGNISRLQDGLAGSGPPSYGRLSLWLKGAAACGIHLTVRVPCLQVAVRRVLGREAEREFCTSYGMSLSAVAEDSQNVTF